ncbi:hypothetical protein P171DRAFT_427319 [Karstenula rhodostoma CBS 690.94]|uniref:Uncharacterized protein n=1 Tax=Karstenula rhodostoma CBS 690.94 TaxID=1392251 RepID=A0A9P4UGH3_9PLEO|nr:hypothetical protein P171DRAFT_427319 [Karstenula rhodostoma CBS 690.94]
MVEGTSEENMIRFIDLRNALMSKSSFLLQAASMQGSLQNPRAWPTPLCLSAAASWRYASGTRVLRANVCLR